VESSKTKPFRIFVLVLDALILTACGISAYLLHPVIQVWQPWVKDPPDFTHYSFTLLLIVLLWVSSIATLGLHRLDDRPWSISSLLWGLAKVNVLSITALATVLYLTQAFFNRSLLIIILGIGCFFLLILKVAFAYRFRSLYLRGLTRKSILLVGKGPQLQGFVKSSREERFPPYFVGRLADETEEPSIEGIPSRIGSLSTFEVTLHETNVDEVVFFSPFNNPIYQKRQLELCEALGIPALFSINVDQPTDVAPSFCVRQHQPFLLFDVAPRSPAALMFKQVFDTVASAIGIILVFPLLLVIMFSIWVTMGRPIFFLQKRAGLFGREFTMYKFRTMVRNAETIRAEGKVENELSGPVFKSSSDMRITPFGRLLRRWSIDELPQLFNVLSGQMSLVGPRPLPIEEQRAIRGWQRRRLSMKPGITGIWQVSGRSEIDFEGWMKLDLKYVDEWSLGLDARLLFQTLGAVLTGRGAK
jgi:exopolysaccharide biosynthesis polyprenyl glycosylphosphotransferase